MRARILTLVCGHAPGAISKEHGDYFRWFQDSLDQVELVPWDISEATSQPALDDFQGLLLTGSPASLTAPEPWMEVAVETIRDASERQTPVLGVCFGHQLVGCAFGAPVIKAPEEGEVGAFTVELTDEGRNDRLFQGLPQSFAVAQLHTDQVDPMSVAHSNGLRVLAGSSNTAVQAMAAGPWVRTVQFHPEVSAPILSSYLQRDGLKQPAPTSFPESKLLFDNWVDGWVLQR